ncbi:MAG: hypothetical protein HRU35_01055 [Rickettsiaceae bacterium]|nr:hypothetical protein [Rickettsiaceae bacterium]
MKSWVFKEKVIRLVSKQKSSAYSVYGKVFLMKIIVLIFKLKKSKFSFVLGILLLLATEVVAKYQDVTTKTQVNKVTNLFKNNISGRKELDNNLGKMQNSAIMQSKRGEQKFIDLMANKSEMQNKKKQLTAINTLDLTAEGRKESNNHKWVNKGLVDINDSSNLQRKIYADQVGKKANARLSNMLNNFKSYLLGCKKTEGNKIAKPKYEVQVKEEILAENQTKYHPKFCEYRQNKYNCRNVLHATCQQRAMKWEAWQGTRAKIFSGSYIRWHRFHWLEELGDHWKKDKRKHRKYNLHLKGDGATCQEIANFIAREKGKRAGHVRVVKINSRGENGLFGAGIRHRFIAGTYTVDYQYRDGEEICVKWQEEWQEQCRLE